jgi:hypothetical protein
MQMHQRQLGRSRLYYNDVVLSYRLETIMRCWRYNAGYMGQSCRKGHAKVLLASFKETYSQMILFKCGLQI